MNTRANGYWTDGEHSAPRPGVRALRGALIEQALALGCPVRAGLEERDIGELRRALRAQSASGWRLVPGDAILGAALACGWIGEI